MKIPNDRLTQEMFNSDYMLENKNWSKSASDIFITLGKLYINLNVTLLIVYLCTGMKYLGKKTVFATCCLGIFFFIYQTNLNWL